MVKETGKRLQDKTSKTKLRQYFSLIKTKGYLKSHLPKDATSMFILGFSVLLVLSVGLYLADLIINKKEYEGYIRHNDEFLNFTVDIPSKWVVGTPDQSSLEEIVKESTGGLVFDTRYSSLKQEVTPLTLIQQDPTGNFPYKKLMVISMFGHESPSYYMNDESTMKEEFKAILQDLGHEGIRIEKVEQVYNKPLQGVVLYARAFFDGKKMYYAHYTENIDKNVLRILYGSNKPIKNLKDIESIMSTFIFHDTGVLDQLIQQGLDLPDGESSEEPSEEHNHEHDHEHDHQHDHEGVNGNSNSGVITETESGGFTVELRPKFENSGDIESSTLDKED